VLKYQKGVMNSSMAGFIADWGAHQTLRLYLIVCRLQTSGNKPCNQINDSAHYKQITSPHADTCNTLGGQVTATQFIRWVVGLLHN